MKTKHTQTSLTNKYGPANSMDKVKAAEKILVEDMTVYVVSDDEESDEKMTERLLAEKISCTECNFVASRKAMRGITWNGKILHLISRS